MDGTAFRAMLATIADAWNAGDTHAALACFASDARYTEPPDTQHYEGRDELYAFFGGEHPASMSMTWHTVVFDEELQTGAAEYTYTGRNTYHGVVVMRLRGDVIANWREYQHRSDLDWEGFTALNPF